MRSSTESDIVFFFFEDPAAISSGTIFSGTSSSSTSFSRTVLGPSFWSYVSEALLFYRVCIVERVAMDTERDRVGVYSEVSGAPPESVDDGVVVVV